MFRFALTALFVVATVAVAAPVPKALTKRPNLNGRWVTTERVEWGEAQGSDRRLVWDIDGEKIGPFNQFPDSLSPAYTTATMTFTQPAPDEIDVVYADGPTRFVYRGRLKWEGDQLLVDLGGPDKPRPAEVNKAAGAHTFYRFERTPAR